MHACPQQGDEQREKGASIRTQESIGREQLSSLEPLHDESRPARNSSLSAKGILTVTLLDGKDLPAMDDNGKGA